MASVYRRLDTTNVRATKGMGGRVYSVLAETDLYCGDIVKVGDIADGENDIRNISEVTNAEVGKAGVRIAFIATPEVNYKDSSALDRTIALYKIAKGEVCDAVPVESGDELAIAEGGIELDSGVATLADAKYLTIGTGKKLKAVATKPASGFVAKIDKIKPATRQYFYGSTGTLRGLSYNMVYFTVDVA